jgi:signal transduction histidine kinase
VGILRNKRLHLFALIVLLPAAFLVGLTIRTFQGEILRERYQQQERQQQVSRLLESELNNWLRSLQSVETGEGITRFQLQEATVFLPELNILVSEQPRDSFLDTDMEPSQLDQAYSFEVKRRDANKARFAYRRLLKKGGDVAALARLALLRLALGTDQDKAASLVEAIKLHDQSSVTESGVPVWVAVALILISSGHSSPEADSFLPEVLKGLQEGDWKLEATQWGYYVREVSTALSKRPQLQANAPVHTRIEEVLKLANWLDSLGDHVPGILALRQNVDDENLSPLVKRQFPNLHSIVVLGTKDSGFFLEEDRLREVADERLSSLTTSEDFDGQFIPVDGTNTGTALSTFPGFEIVYSGKPANGGILDLQTHFIFYSMALLLSVIVAALFFIYRAVTHQIELTRMKTDFVSAVSHEFRSPLSAIQALLERVESGKASDQKMLRRYHRVIRQEVHRLAQMVNELLDFARMEEGRREFASEPVDLNELAREVVQSFENLGYQNRLVTQLDKGADGPILRADQRAVSQSIQNLIDNALKYSSNESSVTVRTGRTEGEAFVEVSDQGPGIPSSQQVKVFEPFHRVGSADAPQVKGVGFGLSLVKRLMEEQGGSVTLSSQVGQGSTFRLIFPVKRPLGS